MLRLAQRRPAAVREEQLKLASDVDRICFPPPPSAFARYGAGSVIAPPARVQMPQCIEVGDGVLIHEHAWLSLVKAFAEPPRLRIGNRCQIGRACQFSICGEVVIEDDVLIGDYVHIDDTYHRYDVPALPAREQPLADPVPVRIRRGAMLNLGAMVLRGVTVGENAFVHAGSVVTRDVPAGAVVAGNPARVLERGSAPWV